MKWGACLYINTYFKYVLFYHFMFYFQPWSKLSTGSFDLRFLKVRKCLSLSLLKIWSQYFIYIRNFFTFFIFFHTYLELFKLSVINFCILLRFLKKIQRISETFQEIFERILKKILEIRFFKYKYLHQSIRAINLIKQ